MDSVSTAKITEFAKVLAEELKMPFAHASLEGSADADSSSFKSRDIPTVTFHGMNNEWQKFLHSSNDVVANIKVTSDSVGYRFLLRFLIKIDTSNCSIFR